MSTTSFEQLVELRDLLQDVNSAYEATREFLESQGVSHYRELNREDRVALRRHLEVTLKALTTQERHA